MCDVRSEQVDSGMPKLIKRSRLGGGQKPERGVKRAGLVFGLRGGQGALGAPRRVGRQSGRAIQKRG